jgi:DNA-binding LytR/AlgR family response regulator
MSAEVHALIADDEENLRAALRRRLSEVWPELVIIAEACDGTEALELAAEYEPEIAFLDIRMPGLDGLEVARRLSGRCHLVFVTAYDEYAVSAFERDAVDYLLKPVTAERLAQTVARLKQRLQQAPSTQLDGLLEQLAQNLRGTARPPLQWIRAGMQESVKLVPVEEVRCFIAADKYTTVITGEGELLIRKPMKELEAELDPQQFWRVHRGAIVNLAFVESGKRDEEGRLWLRLSGHNKELLVSRSYAHRFKQM